MSRESFSQLFYLTTYSLFVPPSIVFCCFCFLLLFNLPPCAHSGLVPTAAREVADARIFGRKKDGAVSAKRTRALERAFDVEIAAAALVGKAGAAAFGAPPNANANANANVNANANAAMASEAVS